MRKELRTYKDQLRPYMKFVAELKRVHGEDMNPMTAPIDQADWRRIHEDTEALEKHRVALDVTKEEEAALIAELEQEIKGLSAAA